MRRSLGFDPTSYQAFMLIDPKGLKPILSEAFMIVMTGDMWQRCKSNVESTMWNLHCGFQFESLIWFSLEVLQWFYRRVPRWVNKGFTDAFTSNKGALATVLLDKKVLPHQTIVRSFTGFFNCCQCFSPFPQMLLFDISMNELSLRM